MIEYQVSQSIRDNLSLWRWNLSAYPPRSHLYSNKKTDLGPYDSLKSRTIRGDNVILEYFFYSTFRGPLPRPHLPRHESHTSAKTPRILTVQFSSNLLRPLRSIRRCLQHPWNLLAPALKAPRGDEGAWSALVVLVLRRRFHVPVSVSEMAKSYPAVSEEYQKAVEKAKRKLRGLIAEKNCAPLMLRLA